ncbi:MAG: epoxyqueuosine reductase QueH [Deltaproteobacteria bacterium]|jgi:predicted adenine nucleotide alpha hydrolase (AANH) superfamily ATPase|nr:epoxyqueuosine reductase QueH [Deltaproteobacteria bacterium]
MSEFEPQPLKSLLLHVCCAPCAIWPIESLFQKYPRLKLHLWFYNPNIQPLAEFRRRRDGLAFLFTRLLGAPRDLTRDLTIDFTPPYETDKFLAMAAKRPQAPERCAGCYEIRLRAAAAATSQLGLDNFSTTLLFSRQQKHDLIARAGREAQKPGAQFYYEDFRVGWKEGQAMARSNGLYRQNYCGCVYGAFEQG